MTLPRCPNVACGSIRVTPTGDTPPREGWFHYQCLDCARLFEAERPAQVGETGYRRDHDWVDAMGDPLGLGAAIDEAFKRYSDPVREAAGVQIVDPEYRVLDADGEPVDAPLSDETMIVDADGQVLERRCACAATALPVPNTLGIYCEGCGTWYVDELPFEPRALPDG